MLSIDELKGGRIRNSCVGLNPIISAMNTKEKGNIALGRAIAWFTGNGYIVSIPLNDSQSYDLVIERINTKTLGKVEVKYTSLKSECGVYKVDLRVNGGNKSRNTVKLFDVDSVDFIFVVTGDFEEYLIPTAILTGKERATINLGLLYKKFLVN